MAGLSKEARAVATDILMCIGFYTRIPVAVRDGTRSFAAAQWAAPLPGIIVGFATGIILHIASRLGLPPSAAAAVALAAGLLLTGALHEDGLADVADGFGGGDTRERKLEIMKDSRIGTYGVCALVLALLVRWSALSRLDLASWPMMVLALVAAHAASRALMPAFMALVPAARRSGLSAGVGRVEPVAAAYAILIGAVTLLLLGAAFAITCAAFLALWFLALRQLCMRQIGGQTGDVLGTLQQGGEIIVLLVSTIYFL